MGLILTAAPAIEPLTVMEAKVHLRVEADAYDENALIGALIVAAREYAEAATRRALVTQSWQLTMDRFPSTCVIRLPMPSLASVESITYTAPDGTAATLPSDDYTVDASDIVGRVVLNPDQSWPDTARIPSAVTVAFTAGYGDAASDVPQSIRQAMLLLIGHWYETRESVNIGNTVNVMPFAVDALLAPHRVVQF